jgi:O-antigen/teichoic acid export membrane protein
MESPKPLPVHSIASGKLLARNSILNLSGMVLPLLVGIIAIPYAIKGLGKEGFGILAIAWVILGYFGLFDFGLSRATTKFVSEMLGKGDVESLPSVIWTAVVVSFGLGVLGAVTLFAATPFLVEKLLKIPHDLVHQARLTLHILAASIPIILCSTSLRGVLEAAQRFDLVNYIMIPANMLSFMFPGLSFPFQLNLSTVVFLIILSRLAIALVSLSFCFRLFPIIKTKPAISLRKLQMMAAYGGWISITSVISPLLVHMDRFFIGTYVSMASVAFYTAPYEVITRLRIFPNAITTTLFPEFSALTGHAYSGRLEKLFAHALKYILISVSVLVVLLFFTAPTILLKWLGPEFVENSLSVFRIFSIGILINCLAVIPFNLLQGIGKPDITAKFHLLEFPLYLFLLWFLVKDFGINGVAFAWVLRVSLDALLLFWFAIKCYPLIIKKVMDCNIGLTLLFLLILFCFLLLLDIVLSTIIYKLILLSLSLLGFGFLIWRFVFDEEERHFVIATLQKRLKYKLNQHV